MKTVTPNKIGRFFRVAACFPALIVAFIVSVATTYAATTIFQEDFDNSPPYTNGSSLPTSFGEINYGRWSDASTGTSTATTPTNVSLSSPRALELRKGASGNAGVMGVFGTNNAAAYTTDQEITVRFAFNLVNNTYAEVYINATDSSFALGLLKIGSGGGITGTVRGYFDGAESSTIGINLNEWYYINVVMSANPAAQNGYSISLYESNGVTQVGSTLSGAFYATAGANAKYRLFQFYNYATADTSIYFDNISVTAVPEPGTVALLGAGLLLLVLRRKLTRQSRPD